MALSDSFRAALEAGDAALVRSIWAANFPHLPAPDTLEAATRTLHMARTMIEGISLRARCYSHAWLTERNLPSQLPDRLKPMAERLYPQPQRAVGITIGGMLAKVPELRPAAVAIRTEMEKSVADSFANGESDAVTRERMMEACHTERKKLFGRLQPPT